MSTKKVPRVKKTTRDQEQREPRAPEVASDRGSQCLLLTGGNEPAPVLATPVVSPAEARNAARVETREAGAAARKDPRRVSKPDRTIAVGIGVGGLERLSPLAFGNLPAVLGELQPHLIEVEAVADPHQLEAAGLDARQLLAGELPALGIIAVEAHHFERLVLGRVEVERELKLHNVGRVLRVDDTVHRAHHRLRIERALADTLKPVMLLARETA
ncbi:MAG: hypothetical protein AUJ34_02430 [Parcubacteria group bacterium CG1_02_41_12]|nr:MAG: hypothetical protein AUJ34_02430 [Parcubacteria group bacterium CG1_02_41_12]